MTEEQFEVLKAWIYAMRDVDHEFAALSQDPGATSFETLNDAVAKLNQAEKRARSNLVED